jgi:hypothetical protein
VRRDEALKKKKKKSQSIKEILEFIIYYQFDHWDRQQQYRHLSQASTEQPKKEKK